MSDIYLPSIIGKGYREIWNFKGRYRVIKGSRGSKKSKTMALWYIYNIMKYPNANALVIRKVYRTLKNSCFSDLQWATYKLKVENLWDFRSNPLEITYKPTGQKILFRGLDDPLKITSISVPKGTLTWVWIEEGYEINDENAFNMLDESIRGVVDKDLFKQITITMNPWNERHWVKKRFFDKKHPNILATTTTYLCNEFLGKDDIENMEQMKINNPRRYQVAGLGEWGVAEGLVFERWEEKEFDWRKIVDSREGIRSAFGLDFGYTVDPSALFCGLIDLKQKEIYVFDEMYGERYSNERIYNEIFNMGYAKEKIIADCVEPKSIDQLKGLGLRKLRPSRKGRDSVNAGVQFIQDFKIIIHPRCTNFLTEISNYCWEKDKFGKAINKPIDDFNHLMDAMRYALEEYMHRPDEITFGI